MIKMNLDGFPHIPASKIKRKNQVKTPGSKKDSKSSNKEDAHKNEIETHLVKSSWIDFDRWMIVVYSHSYKEDKALSKSTHSQSLSRTLALLLSSQILKHKIGLSKWPRVTKCNQHLALI